jgi:hypothetical protein
MGRSSHLVVPNIPLPDMPLTDGHVDTQRGLESRPANDRHSPLPRRRSTDKHIIPEQCAGSGDWQFSPSPPDINHPVSLDDEILLPEVSCVSAADTAIFQLPEAPCASTVDTAIFQLPEVPCVNAAGTAILSPIAFGISPSTPEQLETAVVPVHMGPGTLGFNDPEDSRHTNVLEFFNKMLGKVNAVDRSKVCTDDQLNQDALIRAVTQGWGNLGQFCPIWNILREMDQRIFRLSGIMTRLCMLRMIHFMMLVCEIRLD